mmetsp:Transcript_7437/g.21773  ORF Transcript_7437/g.21773 Transcript_7437/m.21773 type:complete len:206 (+) Transcript_7437:805-1422(+)
MHLFCNFFRLVAFDDCSEEHRKDHGNRCKGPDHAQVGQQFGSLQEDHGHRRSDRHHDHQGLRRNRREQRVQMVRHRNDEDANAREELKVQNDGKDDAARAAKSGSCNVGKRFNGFPHARFGHRSWLQRRFERRVIEEGCRPWISVELTTNQNACLPCHKRKHQQRDTTADPTGARAGKRKSQQTNSHENIRQIEHALEERGLAFP